MKGERHMLILNRKVGQKIIINKGEIEITILYSRFNQVRLGVKAPKDIEVDREEIFLKKQESKKGRILKKVKSIKNAVLGESYA